MFGGELSELIVGCLNRAVQCRSPSMGWGLPNLPKHSNHLRKRSKSGR